ncbi:putative outer membrane protein A [hydrothermal vent metagenome]|uniref:Putative outer membrane protein A n=1 Tax=hydrothermal vent metagenome TaxID=652676 RepID=A0A1W1C879_9ZZZZ
MKNIKLSLIVTIGVISFAQAGGDISPVTPYETEDLALATESAIEEVEVEPVTSKEVVPLVVPPLTKSNPKEPILEKKPILEKEPNRNSSSAYIGIGGVIAQYDTNCKCPKSTLSGTDKTGGVIAKGGYEFNQYIGIEARGVKTMLAEDGGEIEHIGVFLKPSYPISEDTKLYGLVGWAKTTTSGDLRKTDVDGLSFGVGLDYSVTDNVSVFTDYERLFYKSDAPKLDAVSMGANYKF